MPSGVMLMWQALNSAMAVGTPPQLVVIGCYATGRDGGNRTKRVLFLCFFPDLLLLNVVSNKKHHFLLMFIDMLPIPTSLKLFTTQQGTTSLQRFQKIENLLFPLIPSYF